MNKKFELLRRLAQEAKQNPNLILPSKYGYIAYGKYEIIVTDNGVTVGDLRFVDEKIALSYCTLLRYNKFSDAVTLKYLSDTLYNHETELLWRLEKFEQNPQNELNILKLDNSRYRRLELLRDIAKYITLAKHWQNKGHLDETSRIKHTWQQENRKGNGKSFWKQNPNKQTSTSKSGSNAQHSKKRAKRIQKDKRHSQNRKESSLPKSGNVGTSPNTTSKRNRSARSKNFRNNEGNSKRSTRKTSSKPRSKNSRSNGWHGHQR